MGLEFHILWAGRSQPRAWESLCGEYRRRIAGFHSIREHAVRVTGGAGDPARRAREAEALAAAAPEGLWIALDRQGRALASAEWAARAGKWRAEWRRPVVFFLGSDLGLDEGLQARCRERLSFGPPTLPHALARLVLLEQLYRALTVEAGWPYHRP